MNKIVRIAVGTAALAALVCAGSQLGLFSAARAQAPAAAGKTRVAILNLKYVVTNYQRYKNFIEENKAEYTGFENQIKPKAAQLEAYRTQLQAEKDDTKKAQMEHDAKSLQRQLQDLADDARQKLGKKESDQLVLIYREVGAAVAAFAQANGIDLVMHYADGVNEVEMNSPGNIAQKMNQRACTPLFYTQGVDVSASILQMLNSRFQASATPAAGTPQR